MRHAHYGELIQELEDRVLDGGQVTRDEALGLLHIPDEFLTRLTAAGDRVRMHFRGNTFDACALVNARSGLCGEDCAFCAQSAHHDASAAEYGLLNSEEILAAARRAKDMGASRFCTVTSGGALSPGEFDSLLASLRVVSQEVDIHLDASLGFLDDSQVRALHDVGVTRYNHNLETSRDHYPKICTTHDFDTRVETVCRVRDAGLSVCCGGIVGLGETPEQRLDLALTLREVRADCIPINILNPRKGTPLEHAATPEPLEILKIIAIFRLVMPRATIKIAGGREVNLGPLQGMALRSGANGMIIGGYLTTSGNEHTEDIAMVRSAGFVFDQPA
jgi:biotin synthase